MRLPILACALSLALTGCHSTKTEVTQDTTAVTPHRDGTPGDEGPRIMREPATRAFKPGGDYAGNVMVTLSPDLREVISYPECNEVDSSMAPVKLARGYYLDRGGVGPNTVFLRWTYDEYSRLPETPTPSQIIEAVIPDSHIAEIIEIPLGINYAKIHPEMADTILTKRFNEVKTIYKSND